MFEKKKTATTVPELLLCITKISKACARKQHSPVYKILLPFIEAKLKGELRIKGLIVSFGAFSNILFHNAINISFGDKGIKANSSTCCLADAVVLKRSTGYRISIAFHNIKN